MAEHGEWNRKGATLSDATALKEYGVTCPATIKMGVALPRLKCSPVLSRCLI
jgi:hypothetical protein